MGKLSAIKQIPEPRREFFENEAAYRYFLDLTRVIKELQVGAADDLASHQHTVSDVTDLTLGKTIGDVPQYEDDGSSNPVLNHPNAPRVNGTQFTVFGEVVKTVSGVNSTVISGLDGNAAEGYRVEASLYLNSGVNQSLKMQLNGDSGANYHGASSRWYFTGEDPATNYTTNSTDIPPADGVTIGESDWNEPGNIVIAGLLGTRPGAARVYHGDHVFTAETALNTLRQNYLYHWHNTADNITSITFQAEGSMTFSGTIRLRPLKP